MYALMLQLTAVLWLVTQTQAANIVGGANRPDHAALCKFITMAAREVEVPEIPALPTDEYNYIHMVNFSTAPEDWQNMFFEDKASKKAHADPKAAGATGRGFEANWDQWQKTALSHLDATTADAKKQAGVVQLSDTEAALVKPQLAHLAALADELITELSGLQPGPGSTTASSAKQLLTTAAYGEETVPKPNPNPEKVFGAALNGNRDAICEATSTGPQVATTLATLACVCHKGNANTVDPPVCTDQAKGSENWQDADPAATALTGPNLAAIAKSCAKESKEKVTAAELATAITDLDKLIHKGATDAYLGSFVSTKCNGSSGNGVCVKFASYNTKPSSLVNKLTWIPQLNDLVTKLMDLERKKIRAEQLVERIKSLKKETTVVIEVAKATASSMEKFETKTNHQKQTSEATSRCSTHNTNTTCTQNKCKWDGTTEDKGKCVADESKGATQTNTAGTGAAGTTTEKCKDKKKDDCKDGCKWEGETCKDSSILATKKFALSVVSAAFAALLF
uniref:Variant surface glycoprotein Buteba 6 n=1 Tax=Trypanosoma brucei brucei TaxID=5702 RepID=Q571V7_TRYBB|nr:variant surface glycoprotein Buteba 6 [Trypanosoma brucei brucei]